MKVYRGTDGDVEPVEMECELFGHPHRTDTGETMYGNTHFRTESEAWDSILRSVKAGVHIAGDNMSYARGLLLKAEKEAGEAVENYSKAMNGYKKWDDKRHGAEDSGENDE